MVLESLNKAIRKAMAIFSIIAIGMPQLVWAQDSNVQLVSTQSPRLLEYVKELNHFSSSVYDTKNENSLFYKINAIYNKKNKSELFDNVDEDFYLGYRQPFIQDSIKRAKFLKKKLERLGHDVVESLTEYDQIYLTMLYVSKVYLPMESLHALFWDDEASASLRSEELKELTASFEEEQVGNAFGLLSQMLISQYTAEAKEAKEQAALDSVALKLEALYAIANKEEETEGAAKLKELLDIFYNLTLEESDGKYLLKSTAIGGLRRASGATLLIETPHHYLRGARLKTISNMLDALMLKNSIIGKRKIEQIPRSCQMEGGAKLPEQLEISLASEESILSNKLSILEQNGLLQTTNEFRQYYLDYEDVLPAESSFSLLLNFERSFNAYVALSRFFPEKKKLSYYYGYNDGQEPQFDDVKDFSGVIEIKKNQLLNVDDSLAKKYPNFEKAYQELLTSLLLFGDSSTKVVQTMEEKEFSADTEGLNVFLSKLMQKAQASEVEEIIPADVRKIAEKNIIQLKFPSLYASDYWRRFSFSLLAKFFKDNQNSSDKKLQEAVLEVCRLSKPQTSLCKQFGDADSKIGANQALPLMAAASKELDVFLTDHSFLPKINFKDDKLISNYPFYKGAWNILQLRKFLPESFITEWDFLQGQLRSYNGWAALRLSYLILKQQGPALYNRGNSDSNRSNDDKDQDKDDNKGKENGPVYESVMQALEVLGMQYKLTPFHANDPAVLSKKEKILLWQRVLAEESENSYNLFATIDPVHNKNYFQLFREVNSLTMIDSEDIQAAYNKYSGSNIGSKKLVSQFTQLSQSEEYQAAQLLYAMYKNGSDSKKLSQLSDELFTRFGIDGATQIKESFLNIDSSAKLPLYLNMLESAADYGRRELLSSMEQLCALNPQIDDRADFSELFYMTKKAQKELADDPAHPVKVNPDAEKKASWWSERDWTEFKYGMLSGGFFGLSATFTALTSGLGFMVGITVAAPVILAMASLAIVSQLIVFKSSLTQYFEFKTRKENIAKLAALGFTDNEAASAIERSIGWTVMEAVFVLPMVGMVGKTVGMIPRALVNRFELGRAISQGEILQSQFILGLRKFDRKILMNPKKLVSGLYEELVMPVNAISSKAAINENFAKAMADYYGNDPKAFGKLLTRYYSYHRKMAKRLLKVTGPSTEIASMDYQSIAKKVANAAAYVPARVRNYVATREEKIIALGPTLRELQKKLAIQTGREGDSLEKFFADNVSQIDALFAEIPFALKELPYVLLAQGSPASRGRPLLGSVTRFFSEIAYTRRALSARKLLLFETQRENARALLGIRPGVRLHKSSYQLYRQFEDSVWALTGSSNSSVNARRGAKAKEYFALHSKILETRQKFLTAIKTFYIKQGAPLKMSDEELAKILFESTEQSQVAMAEVIWNGVPAKLLLGIDEMGHSASELVKIMASSERKKSLRAFEQNLAAFKLLHLKTHPELYGIL